jgi:uncharacterized membrane protein YphA (DoxX/SURF4 family)
MKAPFLIGRLLFAGFFINSGVSHLQHRKSMAAYARAKGVPQPELAVTLSAVPLLLVGAVCCSASNQSWGPWPSSVRARAALAVGALALMGVDEPWEATIPVVKPSVGDKVRKIGRRIAV